MQRISGRVKTDIDPDRTRIQTRRKLRSISGVVNQPTGLELGSEIHTGISCHDSAPEPTSPNIYASGMSTGTSDHEIAAMFYEFAESASTRAPFYADITQAIGDDSHPIVRNLLDHAPQPQQRPVLLLAAMHYLVLQHQNTALSRRYPSVTGVPHVASLDRNGLAADLHEFCSTYSDELIHLIRTRHTQTNDVSRSALLRLALAHQPIIENSTLIDVGCSAGLNLHLDSYHCTYTAENGSWTTSGGDTAAPDLRCSVRAEAPPDIEIGTFSRRLGFDPHPIDVDTDDAMWLLACVWPDQLDRIERLKEAVAWAKANPVDLRTADALAALTEIEAMQDDHLTIVNSWVLSYLSLDDQHSYRQRLEALGRRRHLTWVYLEQPSTTPTLQHDEQIARDPQRSELTAVTRIDWNNGVSHVRHLGTMHPHGYWFHPSAR